MKKNKKKTARGGWKPRTVLPESKTRGGDLCRDRRHYTTAAALLQEEVGI